MSKTVETVDDILFAKFIESDGRHYKLFSLWVDDSIDEKEFKKREAKLLVELADKFHAQTAHSQS